MSLDESGDARKYMLRWDAAGLLEESKGLVAKDPANAENHKYLGMAYFYLGDYPTAIKHFQEAYSMERWNAEIGNMLNVIIETDRITSKFISYESEHFILRLDRRDEILKDYALDALVRYINRMPIGGIVLIHDQYTSCVGE